MFNSENSFSISPREGLINYYATNYIQSIGNQILRSQLKRNQLITNQIRDSTNSVFAQIEKKRVIC
jgi:hypothetical protein